MKLYIIRHGQSENNLNGCWTGWIDAALTENGIAQAQSTNKYLCDEHFDKVFASDLSRAILTAKNALPGVEPEITPLIREINVGELAGQKGATVPQEIRIMGATEGYHKIGGESKEQFKARLLEFLKMVEQLDCETVAAFTHAGVLRMLTDHIVGIQLPRDQILCGNCAIAVFDYDGKTWRLHSWINTN